MVLVGKTGAGKSSSGNTILGRKAFTTALSASSITKLCCKESDLVAGRQLVLVDTPGLFDDTLSEEQLEREIGKCINMTSPGPHAIVLVIQLGPFTEEDRLSVEKIRAIFGQDTDRYIVILFTHADELRGTIEEHLSNAPQPLIELMNSCGRRYHAFDNKRMDDRTQVLKFLNSVEQMIACNGGECYTSAMFQEVERNLEFKMDMLRKQYEYKLQEQEQNLAAKYGEEINKLRETIDNLKGSVEEKDKKMKEFDHLIKMKDEELNEYRRFYNRKPARIRQEAEQTLFIKSLLKEMNDKLTIGFKK